jgi:hypothetical protein
VKSNHDATLLLIIAIALLALAAVGLWYVYDATVTGLIVRWPI